MRQRNVGEATGVLSDIDVTKDGGVKKKVLLRGASGYKDSGGNSRPPSGAQVKVHYTGRLRNGIIFDTSLDKNKEFSFQLNKRSVILGWDYAVASMQKGEICNFFIQPDYGYGKRGIPGSIPPDSTLLFEIELISWTLPGDLTKEEKRSREQLISISVILVLCALMIPLMNYLEIKRT